MSKKAGPKETELRAMREGKEADGLFDADSYQKELAALREKHLSGIRAKLVELVAKRREIDDEINKLNSVENSITGHASHAPAGGTGRRKRISAEEKLGLAEVLYGKMAASKLNKFSAPELKDFSAGLQPRELIDVWNTHHKSDKAKQIQWAGEKASRRYWVG